MNSESCDECQAVPIVAGAYFDFCRHCGKDLCPTCFDKIGCCGRIPAESGTVAANLHYQAHVHVELGPIWPPLWGM